MAHTHDPRTRPGRRDGRTFNAADSSEPTRAPERRKRATPRARRRKTSRFAGLLSTLTSGALVAILGAAAAVIWFDATVTSAGPLRDTIGFKVSSGQGARAIASRLQKAGVIESEQLFMARYMQMRLASYIGLRKTPILKAGSYEFEDGASVDRVMAALELGRGKLRFITFPEGRTSHAIVARLESDERLTGTLSDVPPEGALLPSTYDLTPGMARSDVIDRMKKAQDDLIADLWNRRSPNLAISTAREAIILASIVQREMGPNDDPKRIASVFHNRLRKGMRLQSDPTILYGIFGGQVNWGKPILRSEIRSKTAHNTYQIPALPPTPICNPGRVAIEAVLQPAETDDLFFVADGKGGHLFSRTLAEHRAKTREWRKIERAYRKRQREEKRLAEAKARAEAAAAKPEAAKAQVASAAQASGTQALPTTATGARDADSGTALRGGASGPVATVSPARSVTTVSVAPTSGDDALADGAVPLPVRKPRR
ncbi:MAG: endolytic transglycosylase MltG [Pseudomonadota bacterium]